MTPYTLDAVELIRVAIAQATPPNYVREKLGWDEAMFERVCRRHGIEIVRQEPLAIAATPSPPDDDTPTVLQRVRDDAQETRRAITDANRPVWRTILISRLACRFIDDQVRSRRVSRAAVMRGVAQKAIMDGQAATIYLLERGDIRRDVFASMSLPPGVDRRLQRIALARGNVKPTRILSSIIESQVRDITIEARQ